MREDACVFFTLLNESYKINAGRRLEDINVSLIPHLQKGDANEIRNSYKKMLFDAESFKTDLDTSNINKLREIL